MSTTHITPTPGRIVWYRGADGEIRPAIVIKGNGQFNADLYVFPLNATDTDWGTKPSVTHADPEIEPGCLSSWHWMPYQKQQAEKHADEPKVAAMVQSTGQITGAGARDDSYVRFQALDMALRSPGLGSYQSVLKAAEAYQAHIAGTAASALNHPPAPGAAHPGYSTMQPHQQRVVDEQAELEGKRAKLQAFFDTPIYAELPEDEQWRLARQYDVMEAYSNILTERIAAFEAAPKAGIVSATCYGDSLREGPTA
jgi:hypothetical protein